MSNGRVVGITGSGEGWMSNGRVVGTTGFGRVIGTTGFGDQARPGTLLHTHALTQAGPPHSLVPALHHAATSTAPRVGGCLRRQAVEPPPTATAARVAGPAAGTTSDVAQGARVGVLSVWCLLGGGDWLRWIHVSEPGLDLHGSMDQSLGWIFVDPWIQVRIASSWTGSRRNCR